MKFGRTDQICQTGNIILYITRDGSKSIHLNNTRYHFIFICRCFVIMTIGTKLRVICRWDEWVPTSRMMKLNEESLMKQADLKATVTKKKPVPVEKKPVAQSSAAEQRETLKKRKRESQLEKVLVVD